ncbi:hypothetical protein KC19_4G232000 [Ceratodon purpureus]|uniref:Uncharacterized protein n=1 Tax=Ceratodon purpureus TaxID=3225 RepID=A0A8T0IE91_CERPU|nr:hypothetical protein KC19_4G232000 [Ceratodon purpureus]
MAPKKDIKCPPRYGGKKKIISKYPDALGSQPKVKSNFSDAVKESLAGKKKGSGENSGESDPRSPRKEGDLKEGCDPNSEESKCAQAKKERMKKIAIGSALGLLFLLLFWWLFKNSIYRFMGWPIDGDGSNGSGGSDGSEDGFGPGGFGSNGVGGSKGKKKSQVCWFNLPCQYDYEDDEWKKPKK